MSETYWVIGDTAYGRGESPQEARDNYQGVLRRDLPGATPKDIKMFTPPFAWRSPEGADGFVSAHFMDGGSNVMWTKGHGDERKNVRRATEEDMVPLED